QRCGGGDLAARHSVDPVVHTEDGHGDVAAGGVDQVVAADGGQVAVAAHHHDVLPGHGRLDAGGKGDRTPVGGVQDVGVEAGAGDPGGTADPRDEDEVVHRETELVDSLEDGLRQDA